MEGQQVWDVRCSIRGLRGVEALTLTPLWIQAEEMATRQAIKRDNTLLDTARRAGADAYEYLKDLYTRLPTMTNRKPISNPWLRPVFEA